MITPSLSSTLCVQVNLQVLTKTVALSAENMRKRKLCLGEKPLNNFNKKKQLGY